MDGPGLSASVTTPEPVVTLLDQKVAASSGARMREKPAGLGPRDGGGAVEPEFVAAAADGDALDRSAPDTPPVTHNLTHTLCPMPLESTGRRHALLDLRVTLERPRSSRSP